MGRGDNIFTVHKNILIRPDLLRVVLLQRGDAAVHVGEAAGDGPHLLQAAGGRGQQE